MPDQFGRGGRRGTGPGASEVGIHVDELLCDFCGQVEAGQVTPVCVVGDRAERQVRVFCELVPGDGIWAAQVMDRAVVSGLGKYSGGSLGEVGDVGGGNSGADGGSDELASGLRPASAAVPMAELTRRRRSDGSAPKKVALISTASAPDREQRSQSGRSKSPGR